MCSLCFSRSAWTNHTDKAECDPCLTYKRPEPQRSVGVSLYHRMIRPRNISSNQQSHKQTSDGFCCTSLHSFFLPAWVTRPCTLSLLCVLQDPRHFQHLFTGVVSCLALSKARLHGKCFPLCCTSTYFFSRHPIFMFRLGRTILDAVWSEQGCLKYISSSWKKKTCSSATHRVVSVYDES